MIAFAGRSSERTTQESSFAAIRPIGNSPDPALTGSPGVDEAAR
jgi:hypothetical protein